MNRKLRKERAIQGAFFSLALMSGVVLSLIVIFLFHEGIPVFGHVSMRQFLLGTYWYPTAEPPDFGALPLILASFWVTVCSGVLSIPLGIMTAIYLAEIASERVREIFKPIVELLAAVPSVVIGFVGMVVVAPFLQTVFDLPTGLNLLNASLMLAFMSIPTICSLSEDALYSVPRELKEASLALGATHWQTLSRVVLPAALSGLSTAVILGVSRAIGETMVVLMVAGGAASVPSSLFQPVRPMPASIAAEMAEAPFRSAHYHALFAIGIVLFLFTLGFNLLADYLGQKYRQAGAATL